MEAKQGQAGRWVGSVTNLWWECVRGCAEGRHGTKRKEAAAKQTNRQKPAQKRHGHWCLRMVMGVVRSSVRSSVQ